MPLQVRIRAEGLEEAVKSIKGFRQKLGRRWRRSAFTVGSRAVELIQRYYRGAGETEPNRTARRTGKLARAYDKLVTGSGLAVNLDLGVVRPGLHAQALKYARTQEYGGIIQPKRARYLTIPLEAAKTAAGVVRAPARSWPNTFVKRTERGLFIFQKLEPGGVRALFKLTKGPIRVPARPALAPVRPFVMRVLEQQLADDFVEEFRAG